LNQQEAMEAMRQGSVVQGINGSFQRHVEHGGIYLYRINNGQIERLVGDEWKVSKGFKLNDNFEIYSSPENTKPTIKPHIEFLYHYQCEKCDAWWSIADKYPDWVSKKNNVVHCPHCGTTHEVVGVIAHAEMPLISDFEIT
jgi:hypothetical protein